MSETARHSADLTFTVRVVCGNCMTEQDMAMPIGTKLEECKDAIANWPDSAAWFCLMNVTHRTSWQDERDGKPKNSGTAIVCPLCGAARLTRKLRQV